MECIKASTVRKLKLDLYHAIPCKVPPGRLWLRPRSLSFPRYASADCRVMYHKYGHPRDASLRAFSVTVSLDEEPLSLSKEDHLSNAEDEEEFLPQPLSLSKEDHLSNAEDEEEFLPQKPESDELKSLLADSERGKLLRKLSEANQYNRFLRRQLLTKDDALVNLKSELAVLELDLQALIGLAEDIANSSPQIISRKINGKYIPSHLLSRLKAVHEKVKEHIKDIDAVKVKDITLFWVGMAEGVHVMGSFDGWTQGEGMSPEYTGSYTRFSTTIRLRPGRYEIKFLVDGEWQLSSELPTVGEGLMQNNLLVVD